MFKIKNKSAGKKFKKESKDNVYTLKVEQPEVKEKKSINPAKKVIYIAKNGKCAIFASIGLCALIFNVDESTIRYKIEHPTPKRKATRKGSDWLKGGRLEYFKD